ncbi:hypothetical protein ACTQ34_09695 [Agathobaculum sp. LCP25S3_E8]|uniref:hypothetical protein n=1 Tax=Agathobaculum sp. LCP25S3_E8 TaxID=3438735 RepID=UPI003F8E29F7
MSKDITCPLDNRPCEHNCPDRYIDRPEGGCLLTTALEQGCSLIAIHDNNVVIMK